MRAIAAALMLIVAATATSAAAAETPDYPAPNGRRVIDEADQIPADVEKRLTDDLRAFQQRTGHELIVLTIPDLGGVPKELYAVDYGKRWGIGRKGADDGIILLESPGDGSPGSGQIFIAVGKGLDPIMTDAASSKVFNETMMPILKGKAGTPGAGLDRQGRIVQAIVAGSADLIRRGSITPEQRAEMDRRIAMQAARDRQEAQDTLWNVLYSLLGIGTTGAGGYGIWRLATRKRRAREAAAEAERQRLLAIAQAEQDARDAAERAAAAERRRQAQEERDRKRAQMLANMTPEARQAFLDDEERQAREAREKAEQQAQLKRERDARDAKARREREEQEARDQEILDEQNRIAAAAAAASAPTYNDAPAQTQNDYSPGGGDFGGAGAGGSFD